MVYSPNHTPPALELRKRRRHFQQFRAMLGERAFSRRDGRSDEAFHDDAHAPLTADELSIVEHLLSTLVVEEHPAVLELVTGDRSLLPAAVEPAELVGLGPARAPLQSNARLTERLVQDVNTDAALPFADDRFDLVLSDFNVPYLLHAERVFDELGRVLRPDGLLVVLFDDDYAEDHAIRYWSEADAEERLMLVEEYIGQSSHFEHARIFVHPALSVEPGSSPVYLVYAEKRGDPEHHHVRPAPSVQAIDVFPPEEVERRKARVAETHECPHCGESLEDVHVGAVPWSGWDTERVYICLNDACPWVRRSVSVLHQQGVRSHVYRAMFHPVSGKIITMASPIGLFRQTEG